MCALSGSLPAISCDKNRNRFVYKQWGLDEVVDSGYDMFNMLLHLFTMYFTFKILKININVKISILLRIFRKFWLIYVHYTGTNISKQQFCNTYLLFCSTVCLSGGFSFQLREYKLKRNLANYFANFLKNFRTFLCLQKYFLCVFYRFVNILVYVKLIN